MLCLLAMISDGVDSQTIGHHWFRRTAQGYCIANLELYDAFYNLDGRPS